MSNLKQLQKLDDGTFSFVHETQYHRVYYRCPPDPLNADMPHFNAEGKPVDPIQKIEFTTLDQAKDPVVRWLARPIIEYLDLTFLTGVGYAGKSTWVAELLLAMRDRYLRAYWSGDQRLLDQYLCGYDPWPEGVCHGGNMKIELPPEWDRAGGGKFLIVDGEQSDSRWRRLMEKTLRHYGVDLSSEYVTQLKKGFVHSRSRPFDLHVEEKEDKRKAQEMLVDFAVAMGCEMIVIDPLWKVYSPKDHIDSSWVTDGVSHLRDVAQEAGITLLIVAHTAKHKQGDANRDTLLKVDQCLPYGSSHQGGMYDSHLHIQKKKGFQRLYMWKARGCDWLQEGANTKLMFGTTGGGYQKTPKPWALEDPGHGIVMPDGAMEMLNKFPVDNPFKFDRDVHGSASTWAKYKPEFLQNGAIEVYKEGSGSQPTLYQLTEDGRNALKEWSS